MLFDNGVITGGGYLTIGTVKVLFTTINSAEIIVLRVSERDVCIWWRDSELVYSDKWLSIPIDQAVSLSWASGSSEEVDIEITAATFKK